MGLHPPTTADGAWSLRPIRFTMPEFLPVGCQRIQIGEGAYSAGEEHHAVYVGRMCGVEVGSRVGRAQSAVAMSLRPAEGFPGTIRLTTTLTIKAARKASGRL
jgi:hypothetical protein